MPVLTSSTTVGSRSTNTARGTCLPAPVSEKDYEEVGVDSIDAEGGEDEGDEY